MKTLLLAAAGVLALSAPLAAQAQSHGYHGGGRAAGGYHGGGGYRGGYGGGYRGGFYRGGYGSPYGYGPSWGWGIAGFALGAALADPWYYDQPYYGDYGYYGPPPVFAYDYEPAAPPPPAAQPSAGGRACGHWIWDPAKATYHWQTEACAPAG